MGYDKNGKPTLIPASQVVVDSSSGKTLKESIDNKELGNNVKNTLSGGETDASPSVAVVKTELNKRPTTQQVNDALSNRPTTQQINDAFNGKQDKLVSGQNIKTVGGVSILGSGDIPLPYGSGVNVTQSVNPSDTANAPSSKAVADYVAAHAGQGGGDSIVAGTNVSIEPTQDGKKRINVQVQGISDNIISDFGCLQERKFIKDNYPYFLSQYYTRNSNGDGNIPISYDEDAYLDRKIKEVANGKHFIFVTDTHYTGDAARNSNYIIDYVRKRLNIKRVVQGGDIIQSGNNAYVAAQELGIYAEEFFSAFGKDAIWCQGNHDGNYVSWLNHQDDENADINDWILPDTEIYKRTTKYIEDRIVLDTESLEAIEATNYTEAEKTEIRAWLKMHYYVDDNSDKIRYIVLETGNGGYTEAVICNTAYHNMDILQWQWLSKTLRNTPVDYDIVIACHMLGKAALELETRKIISAFKGRQRANMDNSKYSGNSIVNTELFNVLYGTKRWNTYDFTDCPERQGKIFIICGHWHSDTAMEYHGNYQDKYDTTSVITYPYNNDNEYPSDSVLNIVTDSCCCNGNHGVQFGGIQNTFVRGTTDELAFDIVTITSDGIQCVRIGTGNNRFFKY